MQAAALSELGGKPAGTIRITSVEHAAKTILWPVLRELMITYPASQADITLDYGLTDIVAERIDARVRLREYVDKDNDCAAHFARYSDDNHRCIVLLR
jgi:DNA-binding transcriptional LysR family regulator